MRYFFGSLNISWLTPSNNVVFGTEYLMAAFSKVSYLLLTSFIARRKSSISYLDVFLS